MRNKLVDFMRRSRRGMRQTLTKSIAILIMTMLIINIGAAIKANNEVLIGSFENNKIIAKSYNYQDEPKDYCYQVRFYKASNFPISNPELTETHTSGFIAGEKFPALNTVYDINKPRKDELPEPSAGWGENTWYIALMKNGTINIDGTCKDPNEYADSYRVYAKVDIPEFPTIALPIAAVLGLVFFFQHRKKKEE